MSIVLTKKQKRAFNSIKTGIDVSRKLNLIVRFLTLTTSETQIANEEYSPILLNDNFRKFKQIIRRTKLIYLLKQGYIANSDLRRYYPKKKLADSLTFDYFKVKTNEGNGVLHILYKGDYIPYNYIVDIWNDLHNTWHINIQKVKTNKTNALSTAGYVVTQYLSSQETSYQRSSKSWLWTIRDYYKQFKLFMKESKDKYCYNPYNYKFYERNRHYAKVRKTFAELPQYTLNDTIMQKGDEVDIWNVWLKRVLSIIEFRKAMSELMKLSQVSPQRTLF